jgi:hypothetical protein
MHLNEGYKVSCIERLSHCLMYFPALFVLVNKNKTIFITVYILVVNLYVVCTYGVMCLTCSSDGTNKNLVESCPVWVQF